MPTGRLRRLYAHIRKDPLARKIWVTASYGQGLQDVRRMARELGPVTNVVVQTVRGLAEERARPAMADGGWSAAAPGETYWIVWSLMREAAAGGAWGGYVPSSLVTAGVADRFHRTLLELRQAGIGADRLVSEAFERPEKARYWQGLMSAYEETLAREKLVDDAGMAKLAEPLPAGDEIFLVDGALPLSAVEKAMLDRISGGRAIYLDPEPDLLAGDSSSPGGHAEWFRALGPMAEAKEALRRAAAHAAWDDCELLLSDYALYAPIVYGLCRRYGVECTFEGGVPMRFSTYGRAAHLFLDWLAGGFRADALATALRQGLVRLPMDAPFGRSDAIRAVEGAGIGWGRERYGLLPAREDANERERHAAQWLHESFRRWTAPLPDEDFAWSAADVAESMALFLEDGREPLAKEDADAAAYTADLRKRLARWAHEPVGAAAAVRIVQRAIESCSVLADPVPQPGKLHIAAIERGGRSGRRYTFVLGMSEEAWAATGRQDPVLLDEERARLSASLETSAEKAARRRSERGHSLGAVSGAFTFSYSSYRLADGAESPPAYELLQLFRRCTGEPLADFERLADAMGEPAGWVWQDEATLRMDEDEALFREWITPGRLLRDGTPHLHSLYPWLAAGRAALEARMETPLGPYDGIVEDAAACAGEGLPAVFSASRLETYARCPLLFFYRDVLRMKPKETTTFDRTRWLDAMQRGSLLHGIFFEYMSDTASTGRHDPARLRAVCERKLREAAERIPAPSPHIYAKECDGIRADCEIFLSMELRRETKPRWFELELHRKDEPFVLELDDGFALAIRGIVDRIDEIAPHRYKIIDYKTGRPSGYGEDAFFAGGTQIQHALYALAAEQWLRRSGQDPQAVVAEAAYAFPTQRGLGEEAVRPQEERREDTSALLRNMLESIRSGLFPPTHKPEHCRSCDFAGVCGPHAEWKKHARTFPENRERLKRLLEVNGSD